MRHRIWWMGMCCGLLLAHPLSAQRSVQSAAHDMVDMLPRATRDLARGTVLTVADITFVASDSISREKASSIVAPGWIARRTFKAGEALRAPGVTPPDLVVTGSTVDVIYSRDGVTITRQGTAIGNGAQGDEVYVRLDNRERLRTIVTGPQTVQVL